MPQSVAPGVHIGPYEIQSALGAGGMGEVYRAHDSRLGRDVAIKVLPTEFASDPDRLRRFEQEARAAAALNHPNILALYDIGSHGGAPYIVSELLDGETLRQRLADGALPVRKCVDLAVQIARGLAAAHEKGIVHRDVKPENLFVTPGGGVKILDFGLAKLAPTDAIVGAATMLPTSSHTVGGAVLGTIGYMSPEQVRGAAIDYRSDIFAFGAVLYEMVSGRRAFHGDSAVETMNAILKEDPPEFTAAATDGLHPSIERIVRRCLEKRPADRFQSAGDLAFALESERGRSGVSVASSTSPPRLSAAASRFSTAAVLASVAVALLVGAAVGHFATNTRRETGVQNLKFSRLTYERGTIRAARFASNGDTVVYSAAWEGGPLRVFVARPDNPMPPPLDMPSAQLFSISRSGELAVSLNHQFDGWLGLGTLARLPLFGSGPRPLADNVREADWTPDGNTLAIVRRMAGRDRLEWPIGKVLYETNGYISSPRVSPDGHRVAFADHPIYGDDDGNVAVADEGGTVTKLIERLVGIRGVAWSPRGDEVWFAAAESVRDAVLSVQSVDLSRHRRTLMTGAIDLSLKDVARDGRVLLSQERPVRHIEVLMPGESVPRDFSLFGESFLRTVGPAGAQLLITRQSGQSEAYLRRIDQPAPVRLGDGEGFDLSLDGKWALSLVYGPPSRILLLPTGTGETKELPNTLGLSITAAKFMPDGRRLLLLGGARSEAARGYIQNVDDGAIKPFTAPGLTFIQSRTIVVAPDGRNAVFLDANGHVRLFPIDGGEPQPIAGLKDGEFPLAWTPNGQSVFITSGTTAPWRIERLDLSSGQRTLWKNVVPLQNAGIRLSGVDISPDATAYGHSYSQLLSNLFLVEGLK